MIGLRVSWLDVKLGLWTLIRYPGLTVIGGLALAIAIGIGAGVLHFFQIYLRPVVPLDAGDRIVSIVNWDATTNRRESRSLHDFVAWREQLTALEDVAAFRTPPAPVSFVPRLRQLVADVDASLRLHQILPATEVDSQERSGMPCSRRCSRS